MALVHAKPYPGLIDDIDSYVPHISEAAKADRKRWYNQPVPDGGQEVADNSDMRTPPRQGIGIYQKSIGSSSSGATTPPGFAPEPTRERHPAAPLPEYIPVRYR